MGFLSDMGEGLGSFGRDLTSGGDGSFSNFAQRVPEGLWRDVEGGWGGAGLMLGSFFGQNEDMPGLRILWAPLLAAGGAALSGGAAGGAAAGGSSAVTPEAVAGVGGQGGSSAAAGTGASSTMPYWQRLLINQGIGKGIGLLTSNGGGQTGGNNDVYTSSSGFYGGGPSSSGFYGGGQTTQPQQAQPTTQPTLAQQNQMSNQQLGTGGLLRRNQSGYGRPYG